MKELFEALKLALHYQYTKQQIKVKDW